MKYSEWIILLGTLCIAFTHKTSRAQEISLDAATFRGTGCPTGSARATVSPDGKFVSILFDRLQASVPQSSGQNDNEEISDENPARESRLNPNLDHKVCNIVMDVTIPQGKIADSVEISFDYRGNSMAEGSSATIFKSVLLSRAGMGQNNQVPQQLERKVWRARNSSEPVLEDWTLSSSASVRLQSRCATQQDRRIRLVLKNIVIAKRNGSNSRGAQITLDSTDISGQTSGQMKVKINSRNCGPNNTLPQLPNSFGNGIIRNF